MKYIILAFAFVLYLSSCDTNKTSEQKTAMDAGRAFIRASLDGNFDKAESLILKDSQNVQFFSQYKTYYEKLPAAEKDSYKKASYEINKMSDIDDSTTLINYSNSFMHTPMDIKVVKKGEKWVVDFKYISAENTSEKQ